MNAGPQLTPLNPNFKPTANDTMGLPQDGGVATGGVRLTEDPRTHQLFDPDLVFGNVLPIAPEAPGRNLGSGENPKGEGKTEGAGISSHEENKQLVQQHISNIEDSLYALSQAPQDDPDVKQANSVLKNELQQTLSLLPDFNLTGRKDNNGKVIVQDAPDNYGKALLDSVWGAIKGIPEAVKPIQDMANAAQQSQSGKTKSAEQLISQIQGYPNSLQDVSQAIGSQGAKEATQDPEGTLATLLAEINKAADMVNHIPTMLQNSVTDFRNDAAGYEKFPRKEGVDTALQEYIHKHVDERLKEIDQTLRGEGKGSLEDTEKKHPLTNMITQLVTQMAAAKFGPSLGEGVGLLPGVVGKVGKAASKGVVGRLGSAAAADIPLGLQNQSDDKSMSARLQERAAGIGQMLATSASMEAGGKLFNHLTKKGIGKPGFDLKKVAEAKTILDEGTNDQVTKLLSELGEHHENQKLQHLINEMGVTDNAETPEEETPREKEIKVEKEQLQKKAAKLKGGAKKAVETKINKLETEEQAIQGEKTEARKHRKEKLKEAGATDDEAESTVRNDSASVEDHPLNLTYKFGVFTRLLSTGQILTKGNKLIQAFLPLIGRFANTRKLIIEAANERASQVYRAFAKELGKSVRDSKKEMGRFNVWRKLQGKLNDTQISALLDKPLTPEEIKAFNELKEHLAKNNTTLTHPLMAQFLGHDAMKKVGNDPYYVTTALSGKYEYRAAVDTVDPEIIKKSGVKTFDYNGRKWVILDYFDSDAEFNKRWNKENQDYRALYPWMFGKDGKLKMDMEKVENIHQVMMDRAEDGRLTSDNVKKMKEYLVNQGYDPADVDKLAEDLYKGNVTHTSQYSRAYRMFVDSLQKRKFAKLGFAQDPVNAMRLQQIKLANKGYRDAIVPQLRDQIVKLEKKKTSMTEGVITDRSKVGTMIHEAKEFWEKNVGKKGDINAQIVALKILEAEVRNKPLDVPWKDAPVFNNNKFRSVVDKAFYADTVIKLWGSFTAGGGHFFQALAYTSSELLPEAPKNVQHAINAYFNTPGWGKAVTRTLKEMKNSRYGSLYKNAWLDPQSDIAFQRAKGESIPQSVKLAAIKAGMIPTDLMIKSGQALVYKTASLLADRKGLKGIDKDNFILYHMTQANMVTSLNGARIGRSVPARMLLFLKNFEINCGMHYMHTYENALRELHSNAGKLKSGKAKEISFHHAATAAVLTAVPIALGGLGANPIANLVGNNVYPWFHGGKTMQEDLQSDPDALPSHTKDAKSLLKEVLAHGASAYSGTEPTFAKLDPQEATQGGEPTSDFRVLSTLVQGTAHALNMSSMAQKYKVGNPTEIFWKNLLPPIEQGLEQFAPLVAKGDRATTLYTTGKQKSLGGNIVMQGNAIKDKGKMVRMDLMGFKTPEEAQATADVKALKDFVGKGYEDARANFRQAAINAWNNNDRHGLRDLGRLMGEAGFSEQQAKNIIDDAYNVTHMSEREREIRKLGKGKSGPLRYDYKQKEDQEKGAGRAEVNRVISGLHQEIDDRESENEELRRQQEDNQ